MAIWVILFFFNIKIFKYFSIEPQRKNKTNYLNKFIYYLYYENK